MSKKTEKASELFNNGKNCAQSVLGAFCEDYNLEIETTIKMAGGFGSGVRSGEICGAVSGAVMVIGLKYGESKELCNEKTAEFIGKFKGVNTHITCKNLLGCDVSTPDGREKAVIENLFETKCSDLVISATEILEEMV